jgi:hypothetical protein
METCRYSYSVNQTTMDCPISIKPTITNLKEKYQEFDYTWTTSVKDSIIREALEQLPKDETQLRGIKNLCKKRWTFASECEYNVVVKAISCRFTETKPRYVGEYSSKFPKIFSNVIHNPPVDKFAKQETKQTLEKFVPVNFESFGCTFNLSHEKAKLALDYIIKLNTDTI